MLKSFHFPSRLLPRALGTTGINSDLLAAIQTMTTYISCRLFCVAVARLAAAQAAIEEKRKVKIAKKK